MRATVFMLVLPLFAGCSNPIKRESPRVEAKDASQGAGASAADGGLPSVAQVRQLFADATWCAPPCAARDALRALMKSDPALVAAGALEVMADPSSKTDQGVGQEAMLYIDDWLNSGPDEAARRRTSLALERVAATGSTFMRTQAYGYLSHYLLPDAKRILVAEAENPARDVRERSEAGRSLGIVMDDFELVRRWLADDQPLHWFAGLEMMKTFQPDGNDRRRAEERALTLALGKRPGLPGEVVSALAFYYQVYLEIDPKDAEVRAVAERWVNHPDDMAAGQMRKILLAYTSWQLPPR